MWTHVICVHIYLLFIAVVTLHLVAIFIFSHLCQYLCNCSHQRLNAGVMFTNVGSVGALQQQCSGTCI